MVAHQVIPDDRLLRALAEQLKLPLLQIARQSELGVDEESMRYITKTADRALQLLDSYLLSTDLHAQQALQLEPVTVSSVLQSVSEELRSYAQQRNCEIELDLSGRYMPIMGNFEALRAAFLSLGNAVIASRIEDTPGRIILAAHRSARGIVAGIFGEQSKLTSDVFRRARALYGSARQPMVAEDSSAAAGVFIADALLSALGSSLRVAHHNSVTGLAVTLSPSYQLALV